MDFAHVKAPFPKEAENRKTSESCAERAGVTVPLVPIREQFWMMRKQVSYEGEPASENGGEENVERHPSHPDDVQAAPPKDAEHTTMPEKGRHADGRLEGLKVPDCASGGDFPENHDIECQSVPQVPQFGEIVGARRSLGLDKGLPGFRRTFSDIVWLRSFQLDLPLEEEGESFLVARGLFPCGRFRCAGLAGFDSDRPRMAAVVGRFAVWHE